MRKRPLGRYRYVRLRWRVLFAVLDFVGKTLLGACRTMRRTSQNRLASSPCADETRVILLVQLDHLGDAIISTAILPALRAAHPGASIEVLAGVWNREVFEASPEVDRVHVARVGRFARSAMRLAWIPATLWWGAWLRRRQVDVGIDVRGDFPAALILWLCGARRRVGWECGGGGFLLTDSADFVPNRPEVESRWALLAALGISTPTTIAARRPRLAPTATARREIARRLADSRTPATQQAECGKARVPCQITIVGLTGRVPRAACPPLLHALAASARADKPPMAPFSSFLATRHSSCDDALVVLHLGAGTRAKRWPVEYWRELLGRILVGHAVQVVLVGSGHDRIIAGRLLGGRPWPGVLDWTGRLTFVELAALLQRADVTVGADSGPAHLAAAVGTPAIVLFSGTNDVCQWQPYGRHVNVVRHELDCSPCHRQRCPWPDHPCMRGLRPQRVAAEVERALELGACRTAYQGHF